MVLPFLSIYLNQIVGMSLTQCGIIMACYGLGSVSGAFLGGILTDRVGYYQVMLISLVLTSGSFFVVMQLKGFESLCVGFFAISFIADCFRPANLTAIEAFSKKENLTRSIALIRLAINLGYAFGPFLGGYIAGMLGYNFLFIFNGASVLMAALFFYLFFRYKKKSVEKTDHTELNIQKMPWQDKPYLLFLMMWALVVIVFFQLIYIIPLFYKRGLGFDEAMVGLLMGLNGLLIFLIEMPLVYSIERYMKATSLVVVGGLLIGLSVLAFAVFNNAFIAAGIFLLLITIGEIMSFPFSNTVAMSFSNDRNRGKYMGFYTMTFSMAHVIAPLVWMKIADLKGFDMVWYVGAATCVFACTMIYLIKIKVA